MGLGLRKEMKCYSKSKLKENSVLIKHVRRIYQEYISNWLRIFLFLRDIYLQNDR